MSNQDYRRTDAKLNQNINLFQGQTDSESGGEWFPATTENPCTLCGACETICTQKLKIIEAIEDMYSRASICGFSLQAREERLRDLLIDKGHKKVGLYPKDRFAVLLTKLYKQFFGEPDFEWVAFNSDKTMWGRVSDGLMIHAPDEIAEIKPDIVIVCNYTYQEEIYNDLQHNEKEGIKIVKLHSENDVPWVF